MSARALILSTWSVSVSNNKITQTSDLNSFFFFLIVLEVGESKIKVPANLALDEDPPPGLQMTICILRVARSSSVSYQGTDPIIEAPPSWPHLNLITSQRLYILIPSYWGFSSVQSLSHVWLFATPWTAACQASLSTTNSWSLLKLMSIESVMPSNHLILCRPLLLPPSIFYSIRVFSNESVLHIRWPKYWSFNTGD